VRQDLYQLIRLAILHTTPGIPYSINSKKVEVAIKKLPHGEQVNNKSAVANPESLTFYSSVTIG